jgi:hypothetical protein
MDFRGDTPVFAHPHIKVPRQALKAPTRLVFALVSTHIDFDLISTVQRQNHPRQVATPSSTSISQEHTPQQSLED